MIFTFFGTADRDVKGIQGRFKTEFQDEAYKLIVRVFEGCRGLPSNC